MDRASFARLTPGEYLKRGYLDATGQPDPKLFSTYATAACVQLEATQTSTQELAGTLEALRQVLPWHQETDPQERIRNAVDEALQVASAVYGQPNNPGIATWLEECTDFVHAAQDLSAFIAHFTSVVRQYTVIAGRRSA